MLGRAPELPRAGERAAVVLPSGRTLMTAVREARGDGTLTLEAQPGPLEAGQAVELRWAAGGRWCSQECQVERADEGRLRLRGVRRARGHSDRRAKPRREPIALVELTVTRAADVMPGTRTREWVVDLGPAGLAFDTELALAAGDRLRVDVLPDGRGAILGGAARVVRRERPPGALASRVGIVLDAPPAELAALLREAR